MGWNPGDEREIFTLKELEQEFSLDKVNKSGAVFNIDKLNWLNEQHIRRMDNKEIIKELRPTIEQYGIKATDEYLEKVINCMKDRVHFIKEL